MSNGEDDQDKEHEATPQKLTEARKKRASCKPNSPR